MKYRIVTDARCGYGVEFWRVGWWGRGKWVPLGAWDWGTEQFIAATFDSIDKAEIGAQEYCGRKAREVNAGKVVREGACCD